MRPLILLVWLLIDVAGPCYAKDIFVDNVTGDDLSDGSSETMNGDRSGPVRTIAKALRVADVSDRVYIANTGQPYRESITLQGGRNSGSERLPFAVFGNGAVLDGTVAVPVDAWEHFQDAVYRFKPAHKHYQQLFLDGKPLTRILVDPESLDLPDLEALQWALWEGYVYFRVEPDRLPESYNLMHSGEKAGITVYQVRHAAVFDLVVQGFSFDGVNVHDAFGPSRLAGLTCRGNGRSGIAIVGATRVQVEGCLLGANGESQLLTDGLTETYLINCDLIEDAAPKYIRKSGRLIIDGQPME